MTWDWKVLIIPIQWHSIPAVWGWQGINKDPVSLSPRCQDCALFPKSPPMLAQCASRRCPLCHGPGFTNIGKNSLTPTQPSDLSHFKFLSFLNLKGVGVVILTKNNLCLAVFSLCCCNLKPSQSVQLTKASKCLANFARLLASHCRVYVFREV